MIVAVALRFERKLYSLPKPNRHHDVRNLIIKETGTKFVDVPEKDEGFLDENGTYYNRKQALYHALKNKQVKDPNKIRCQMLTSEDVW